GTVDGLESPRALVVSADGGQVYVVAKDTSAVIVFGTRCGDNTLDAGEQCDDGNGKGGDGCSAGCRLECETVAECQDGDSCTEARCRGGECVRPRCGFTGGLCEIDDDSPGLQGLPQCTGRSAMKLGRTIRQRLKQARHELRQAQRQPSASGKTVATHVGTLLTSVTTKAQKLEKRQVITSACYGSLSDGVDAMKQSLSQIVQRKGLCASRIRPRDFASGRGARLGRRGHGSGGLPRPAKPARQTFRSGGGWGK